MSARARREDGAVAVLVAVCAMTIFLLAALVVDLGLARDTRTQSQNASDASALAAVNKLYPSGGTCTLINPDGGNTMPCYADAAKAARDFAADNFDVTTADWSSCSDPDHYFVPVGYSQCISFTDAAGLATQPAEPSKVRVMMPVRDVKTGLGNLAGVSHVDVLSMARATLDTSGVLPCGVCVLGTGTHSTLNGDVSVTGSSISINGNLSTGPNGDYTAGGTISVQGTATGGCCTPAATTGSPLAVDPLAGILSFPLPGTMTNGVKTNPCTDGPGRYGAFSVPNSTCTLSAGLYVITGAWDLKNNSLLQGTGVTLYFTCGSAAVPVVCNNFAGGSIDLKNGSTDLRAPTSGPLTGLVIAYDPKNTAPISMQGNGDPSFTGTIYAPSSLLSFPGNSCATTFDSAVIVGDISSNGTKACLSVSYSSSQNVQPPPSNAALDQ
jgi:Flp pilus assembly protein TadG